MNPTAQQPEATRGPGDHFLAWFDYDLERSSRHLSDFRPVLADFFAKKGRWLEAADLVQEVFNRTIDKFQSGYLDREPRPYLFRVAHFVYLETLRRRPTDQLPENFEPADRAPSIERTLVERSTREQLRAAIKAALSPEDFELLLRYSAADVDGR